MQIITEIKNKDGSHSYERVFKVDGQEISKETIDYRHYSVKHDNRPQYIIYDQNMVPIPEAFGFLNQPRDSVATRRQAVAALKLLYVFENIIGKKLADFTLSDIDSLKCFLHGISYGGTNLTFNLRTVRSNETVNSYLGIYRKYSTFIGQPNELLFMHSGTSAGLKQQTDPSESVPYLVNDRVAEKRETPRYISLDDLRQVLAVIHAEYTLREELIVRLMFEHAMRIGEILGLTTDDVVCEKIEGTGYVYFIYIRNRLSDDPISQSAKSAMKISNVADYKSSGYHTEGYGYERIIISRALYDMIDEYIETVHGDFMSRDLMKFERNAAADRVRRAYNGEIPNHYIFLNTRGTPLKQSSWNCIMREIFKKAGLNVDTIKKEHNLNHRFRHGFAMFRFDQGSDILNVGKSMRHHSPASTSIYCRPTIADSVKTKEEFEADLKEAVPELYRY